MVFEGELTFLPNLYLRSIPTRCKHMAEVEENPAPLPEEGGPEEAPNNNQDDDGAENPATEEAPTAAEPAEPKHVNFAVLDGCAKHLDGETVLPKPRVSREAIILVLKEHNAILSALRSDLGGLTTFVAKIAGDVEATKNDVSALQADAKQQRLDIDDASNRINAMEDVTSSLTAKLEQVDQMALDIESQGAHLVKLQEQTDSEAKQAAEFRSETDLRINAVGARTKDLEAGAKAIQQRMDGMKDEIQITADQVVYTRKLEAGEGEGETDLDMVLTDVLHDARGKVSTHDDLLEVQRKVLRNHSDELDRKAKVEVEDMADRHEAHLARIQKKMDADADVDLGDIRRNQETITTTLEAVQAEMLEKTDKTEVDSKIEHKYEEILDHLQTALNATEEDEDDFKAATEQLRCEARSTHMVVALRAAGVHRATGDRTTAQPVGGPASVRPSLPRRPCPPWPWPAPRPSPAPRPRPGSASPAPPTWAA